MTLKERIIDAINRTEKSENEAKTILEIAKRFTITIVCAGVMVATCASYAIVSCVDTVTMRAAEEYVLDGNYDKAEECKHRIILSANRSFIDECIDDAKAVDLAREYMRKGYYLPAYILLSKVPKTIHDSDELMFIVKKHLTYDQIARVDGTNR